MSDSAAPTPAPGRSALAWVADNSAILYPILVILALVALFAALNPFFATFNNFMNIGRQSSVLLIVALAGTMVILIGSIDLSVGSTVALSGVVAALTLNAAGPVAAVLAGIGAGVLIGAVNGTVMLALKVPSFLVTIGMLSVLAGMTNIVSNGQSILFGDYALTDFVNASPILGVPNIIFIALVTTVALILLSFKTVFGRHLFAIGGGELVAANAGVPVARLKILAFMLCGGLAGLGGVVLASQVGAGSPTGVPTILLDSIAAIVMGGTALSGGIGGPQRTILGTLVIAILSNGMDVTGVSSFTQQIVKGLVIILAVASTIDRSKYPFTK